MNDVQKKQIATFVSMFVVDLQELGLTEAAALILVRKACSSLLATMPDVEINEHNALDIAVSIKTAVYACYHPGRDFVVSRPAQD